MFQLSELKGEWIKGSEWLFLAHLGLPGMYVLRNVPGFFSEREVWFPSFLKHGFIQVIPTES